LWERIKVRGIYPIFTLTLALSLEGEGKIREERLRPS
jgi:hypothetical protein